MITMWFRLQKATVYIQQQDRSSCHVNTVLNYATQDTYKKYCHPENKNGLMKIFYEIGVDHSGGTS
jgi:hypothetical protein